MFEYYEQLTGEEQEKIQSIIQKLYRQTYLLERKWDKKAERMVINKDFYFCDKHMEFLTAYFSIAGIRIYQNMELGTIYIQGETTMGEKLPKLATIYLLLLKLIYDEQMATASSSVNIATTFGELNGKAGEFKLLKSLSSITEIRRALAILKKYQMIEFLDILEELNENTRIIIYPCINVVLMREDLLKLIAYFANEEIIAEKDVSAEAFECSAEESAEATAEEIIEGDSENGEWESGI
ncbi:MAG: DUF4194 domain-containing protein [Lachnospiraceae bacterium]|nr:DUF4194 domain-containing protein [Lachnospiraceae bacterium]